MISREKVIESLRRVLDPEIGLSIVELDMVKDVKIRGTHVDITVALTVPHCPLAHTIRSDIEKELRKTDEVQTVGVTTTSMSREELAQLSQRLQAQRGRQGPQTASVQTPGGISRLDKKQIRSIIAVVSGKGGVGKSFVTSALAVELKRQGYEVGILDADIPGPSIPKIFGLNQRPTQGPGGIIPVTSRSGIKIMSMNLMADDPTQAFIWRGPIVNNIIRQLYSDVDWGELHYLLVDLPPGTSDAPLTVFQSLPVDGTVIVSTPQDLALLIVTKAINMAKKMEMPIVGLIENMNYVKCPNCDHKIYLYGESGALEACRRAEISLLGSIPFDPEIARLSDMGLFEEYHSPEIEEVARTIRISMVKLSQDDRNLLPIAWTGGKTQDR